MITSILTSLPKFPLRCGLGILALLILMTGTRADEALKLDAKGRHIYETLLDSPLFTKFKDESKGIDFELLRVSGHPRYAKPPSNGSIAEVIYDFKPPTGTNENRIRFLIYPDSKSAKQNLGEGGVSFNLLSDWPQSMILGMIHSATETFEIPQHAAFTVDNERALVQFAYQIDRMVIIGKTDANFPGVVIQDSDKLEKFANNEAKSFVERGWRLLAFGKTSLDQPEIKALLK